MNVSMEFIPFIFLNTQNQMQGHLDFLNNLDLQQGKILIGKYFEYRSNANLEDK